LFFFFIIFGTNPVIPLYVQQKKTFEGEEGKLNPGNWT